MIAIHHFAGSFSDQWIKYCDDYQIPYKLVNCYASDIIAQLADCNGLMWHWSHRDYRVELFARQLTLSLEKKGIKVFPNVNTSWHYNDKLGQKYLLEAIGAPLVKTHVFYSKNDALNWIRQTSFPKVFKLRGGAGSVNVSLVKTKQKARRLANKAFSNGFSHINSYNRLKFRIMELQREKSFTGLLNAFKSFARIFIPTEIERFSPKDKGYIYFQDFIPENNFDTRLVVIGGRCFGARRYCRKGDFRASGGDLSFFEPELIDIECVKIAFDVSEKINAQSFAFDFIKDKGENKIIEISYGFPPGIANAGCKGFWDKNLKWHNEPVKPEFFMIEDFLEDLKHYHQSACQ